MSDTAQSQPEKKGKPFTAAFELQTKIRLIIQDVMSATVRKVSQFNEKVENFQSYFFTYKQRINQIESRSTNNEESIKKIHQLINANKLSAETEALKLEQAIEKMKIQKTQQDVLIRDINKRLQTVTRHSQAFTSQLSKTKSKFIEMSESITAVKEDVAWKITKYVEQTAQTNTKIKIQNQQIKKEYFNATLALEKNKERYDAIIAQRDNQENFNKKISLAIDDFKEEMNEEKIRLKELNSKLEQMDTALYGKIKFTESKLNKRIVQLEESNEKIQQSVKKVETFTDLLQNLREESERIRRQLLKKFEDSDQRYKDNLEQQILKINKLVLQYEKTVDKKVKHLSETQQKSSNFIIQKMDYLKLQIETQLSSKTTAMLQEKSQSNSGASSAAVRELTQKINKISLQTSKSVVKMESVMKEVKREIMVNIEQTKQTVNEKVAKSMEIVEESVKSGIDPEILQAIHTKIETVQDRVDLKLFQMNKELTEQNLRVLKVEKIKEETLTSFMELKNQTNESFAKLQEKINNKVEKVMFLVTKIRGDAIIKNQFIEKEIKELKKINDKQLNDIQAIDKLVPAFGQSINLIMCLIFDAEYQHSRIIQDSLGGPVNPPKFQNLLEGVLYQFTDKKKPGSIVYRHKQFKKIDIVRDVFEGYISVWEDLYHNNYKQKTELIPKMFFKNQVEKNRSKNHKSSSTPKQQIGSMNNIHKQQVNARQLKGKGLQQSRQNMNNSSVQENYDPLNTSGNKSFQIRKKKNAVIKSNDLIMVVSEEVTENKKKNKQ